MPLQQNTSSVIPLIKDYKSFSSAISKRVFAQKDLLETTICLSDIATLKNGYAFHSSKYNPLGKWKILTIANVSGERYINNEDCNCIINLPSDIQNHQVLKEGDIFRVDVNGRSIEDVDVDINKIVAEIKQRIKKTY